MQHPNKMSAFSLDTQESGADWEDPWIDLGGEG
jgi:hypothetical protein